MFTLYVPPPLPAMFPLTVQLVILPMATPPPFVAELPLIVQLIAEPKPSPPPQGARLFVTVQFTRLHCAPPPKFEATRLEQKLFARTQLFTNPPVEGW